MSHVETLAALPCPTCDTWSKGRDGYQSCATCHGTGALVPGLRQFCEHCTGTGFNCQKLEDKLGPGSSVCGGSGWFLIPQAEQMGVLVQQLEVGQFITIMRGPYAGKMMWRWRVELAGPKGCTAGHGDTPEEALADAFLQGG